MWNADFDWDSFVETELACRDARDALRGLPRPDDAALGQIHRDLFAGGAARDATAALVVPGSCVVPLLQPEPQETMLLLLHDESEERPAASPARFRGHALMLCLALEDELRATLRDVVTAHREALREALRPSPGAQRSFDRWWGAGQVTLGALGLALLAVRQALQGAEHGALAAALAARFGAPYVDAARRDEALVECLMRVAAFRNAMAHEPTPGRPRPTIGDYPALCRDVVGHDSLLLWFDFGPRPDPALAPRRPSASSALLHHHLASRPGAPWLKEVA